MYPYILFLSVLIINVIHLVYLFWYSAIYLLLFKNLGQFTRNYTQTTKRGLLTTNKG